MVAYFELKSASKLPKSIYTNLVKHYEQSKIKRSNKIREGMSIVNKIVSIMTMYYPQLIHIENAKKISNQSDVLIVCDNTPGYRENPFIEMKNIKYLPFGENLGLSKAFNRALSFKDANLENDDYIIFFDQDSIIPEGHIRALIDEFINLNNQDEKIGCLGPVYFDLSTGQEEVPRLKTFVNDRSMKVSSIVTTSMLSQYKKLKSIGFWNENIFLDMADWDICWRFYEKDMNVYLTYTSVIRHNVGRGIKKIGPFRLRVGQAFREYYQTRECLYLFFKRYVPIKYKIRFVEMLTIRPLLHFLFLDDKSNRLRYILKGIKDFFKKKRGSL